MTFGNFFLRLQCELFRRRGEEKSGETRQLFLKPTGEISINPTDVFGKFLRGSLPSIHRVPPDIAKNKRLMLCCGLGDLRKVLGQPNIQSGNGYFGTDDRTACGKERENRMLQAPLA